PYAVSPSLARARSSSPVETMDSSSAGTSRPTDERPAREARRAAVPTSAHALVRAREARPPVAARRLALRGVGLGGDAPADDRHGRRALLPALPRALS